MWVYKDTLESSRIHEIIDKLENYPVFKSGKLMEDKEGPYLWLDFYEEIPVYYAEDQEPIKMEVWAIREGKKFEIHLDSPKLIVEL